MKVRLAVACLLLLACAPVCAAQEKEKGKEQENDKQGSLALRQMGDEEGRGASRAASRRLTRPTGTA